MPNSGGPPGPDGGKPISGPARSSGVRPPLGLDAFAAGNVIGTNREGVAASNLTTRAAASNRSMKISANMAQPPWFAPLTLATRFRFKIGCYGPRCGPELANTSSSQSPLVFVGMLGGGRITDRCAMPGARTWPDVYPAGEIRA